MPAPTAASMTMMYLRVMSDIQITIFVGSGSSAPMPLNMLANVGSTNTIMKMITRQATLMIVIGYTMALLTCPLSLAAFSMYVDSRCRQTSSTPPDSPTASMLTNRLSKVFGYLPKDSASVAPPWTSLPMRVVTSRRTLDSLCSDRIDRHCAMGRPAATIVEN